jgi:hypothetical protein
VAHLPIPPLYGALCKLFDRWIDPPELALRLPAVLAGILLVPVAYAASRALRLPRSMAMAGAAACCVSYAFVIWSRELKQYEAEALLGALFAWLVFRIGGESSSERGGWKPVMLIALGLAGPWLGYGFVFAAGPLLVLLVLPGHSGRSGGRRLTAALGGGALLLSIGLMMAGSASQQAADASLKSYISAWFIDPLSAVSWGRAAKYTVTALSIVFVPFELVSGVFWRAVVALAVVTLAAVGLMSWPRRTRFVAAFWLFGPWLTLLIAATLRLYPYGIARTTLFLLPPLVILCAVGFVRIGREVAIAATGRGGLALVGGPLLILAAALPFVVRISLQDRYWVHHDYPALLRGLKEQRRPHEKVVVSLQAASGINYYADDLSGFVVTPAAGTLAVHGLDYDAWYRERISPRDAPFWLITDDVLPNQALIDVIESWQFRMDLRLMIGEESPFGNVRLYRVVGR